MLAALVLLTAVMLFVASVAWLVLQLDGPRLRTGQAKHTDWKPVPTYHLQEHREKDAA